MDEGDKSPDWKGYGVDQAVIEQFVRTRFGDKVMDNKEERAARVLEEAIELFQVDARDPKEGRAKAHKLIDVVFDKKVGDRKQEIGGLGVTLLALCAAHEHRLDELVKTEIARIMSMSPDHFLQKQTAKSDLGVAERPE